MINFEMTYTFGDLDATVVFTNDSVEGVDILHVYVGQGIDILGALTVSQLDEIVFYANDFCLAA